MDEFYHRYWLAEEDNMNILGKSISCNLFCNFIFNNTLYLNRLKIIDHTQPAGKTQKQVINLIYLYRL